ncbi:extracellular matrix protein 1 [Myripristis murdjan]|uniref:extracellular matrix protein 1 n=1 Tax=Myripristis murdjan TaxID=586833 RepID=UPI0011761279|nr:extracellular matrix protein 1-like [Myripristis murdjan]
MILTAGITGFWILSLLTLDGAELGVGQRNSLNEPDVPFPPACPTAENLAAICHHGHGRPRYPPSFFPKSGASHFRRCGNAINRLESWYSVCCSGQVAQQSSHILCCAQQAWRQALSQFCVDEYATMTVPYECCEDRGEARWTCFNTDVPNPFYTPTLGYTAPSLPQEPGFTFNLNAC